MSSLENITLVTGNRWSALSLVALHVLAGKKVHWLYPVTGKMWNVFPSLRYMENEAKEGACSEELEQGVLLWEKIFSAFHLITDEELQTGQYIREFRNKAFRVPRWVEAESFEESKEVKAETLFGPEKRVAAYKEGKFEEAFSELCQKLTQILMEHPLVTFKKDNFLLKVTQTDTLHFDVEYSGGEKFQYSSIYCADELEKIKQFFQFFENVTLENKSVQWSDLLRRWQLGGMLQVEFIHTALPKGNLDQGWILPLVRESYEEHSRHVLGYFNYSENKSRWTVFLTSEEQENNQEIAKKIRRMKQALGKAFSNEEFYEGVQSLPKDWSATIEKENVLLLESSASFTETWERKNILINNQCGIFEDFYGPEESVLSVYSFLKSTGMISAQVFFVDKGAVAQSENTDTQATNCSLT